MGKSRVEQKAVEYLSGTMSEYVLEKLAGKGYHPRTSGGPAATAEILEYINNSLRHGTTSGELRNVLKCSKNVVALGYVKQEGTEAHGVYDVREWASKTWLKKNKQSLDATTRANLEKLLA